MRILYFAAVREKTGKGEETVQPPASVKDVASLMAWLKVRGPEYEAAFAEGAPLRAAVNQEYVPFDHPVGPGDEVAFFPPVTGG